MAKLVKLKQRTPEWFLWRKNKISASMIPTIMGMNPHKTPLQLYDQIMSGSEEPVTEAMQRGTDMEGTARLWAEDLLNTSYPEACIEHKLTPWFIASLDGFNNDAKVKAIEIKCPGPNAHHQAKLGVVPSYYYAQLQWQMFVADIPEMFYISFDGKEGEVIKVKADEKTIEKAIEAANAFRTSLVSYIPPEPTDRDLIEVSDPNVIKMAASLREIKDKIKALEDEEKELTVMLVEEIGNKSSKLGDCRMVKFTRRGNVDYAKIPELADVDLEKYRKKPIESWRFT